MMTYHNTDDPDDHRISSDDITVFLHFLEVPYHIPCRMCCIQETSCVILLGRVSMV
jgi:hypothetical protein